MNMEADEAGRLRAFREKFGRGWDAERMDEDDAEEGEEGAEGREKEDNLVDLISAFGRDVEEGKNEGKKKDFKGKKEDR